MLEEWSDGTLLSRYLAGLLDSDVRVTREIQAKVPDAFSEHMEQTLRENCRTLGIETVDFVED